MAKRPRDANQLAKQIVDISTGDAEDTVSPKKRSHITRGRAGGVKGGAARAKMLSAEQRRSIARKAARARWGKN